MFVIKKFIQLFLLSGPVKNITEVLAVVQRMPEYIAMLISY